MGHQIDVVGCTDVIKLYGQIGAVISTAIYSEGWSSVRQSPLDCNQRSSALNQHLLKHNKNQPEDVSQRLKIHITIFTKIYKINIEKWLLKLLKPLLKQ